MRDVVKPLLWLGACLLVGLALVSAAGRAVALTTGAEPFASLYRMLPEGAVEDSRLHDRWMAGHAAWTWIHILSGTLVLGLALWQFVPAIRRRLGLHRWTGRLILLAAIPVVLSGLALQSQSPFGGAAADLAILCAALLFSVALVLAYRAIRRRDQARHREWMIRMLAVALGVGMVRLIAVPIVLLSGRRPLEMVAEAFWLGFAIPVLAGELWIRRTRPATPSPARIARVES